MVSIWKPKIGSSSSYRIHKSGHPFQLPACRIGFLQLGFNELKTFCSCKPLGCGFSHITPWDRCVPLLSPLTRALDLLQCVKTLKTSLTSLNFIFETLWIIWTCSLNPCFCLSCIWFSLLCCAYVIECKWNCACLLSEGGHLLYHLQPQSRPVCNWCWGCKHQSYW